MTTANMSIRIPWGSCGGWVWAMRESAGRLGLGLHLEHTSDWGAFATWYELKVTGPEAAVQTFCDWLAAAIMEAFDVLLKAGRGGQA